MTDRTEGNPSQEASWASDPDVQKMLLVRDGEPGAYRDLFAKYVDSLTLFAVRFVGSRARAEELVQDAFLQIFRARHRYEPRARFVTYLYRVTTNLCLNEVRRFEYHGNVEPLERAQGSEADDLPQRQFADEGLPTAEEQVAGREAADRIQDALGKLPPNQKTALLLSRVEGFSYQECAECLDLSVSAVKSLVFRATRTLRKELSDLLE